jgi:hypothetical protein
MSQEKAESIIKLMITFTFCFTVLCMVSLSMYSLVFVTQPMEKIAPADKQFFFLLSDMSKYILGSLGTLLAIKGKDAIKEMMDKPKDEPPKDEPPKEEPAPKEAK